MGREQDWKEIEKTQLNYEQGLKDQYKGIDIIKISKENRKTIHKMKKINAKADKVVRALLIWYVVFLVLLVVFGLYIYVAYLNNIKNRVNIDFITDLEDCYGIKAKIIKEDVNQYGNGKYTLKSKEKKPVKFTVFKEFGSYSFDYYEYCLKEEYENSNDEIKQIFKPTEGDRNGMFEYSLTAEASSLDDIDNIVNKFVQLRDKAGKHFGYNWNVNILINGRKQRILSMGEKEEEKIICNRVKCEYVVSAVNLGNKKKFSDEEIEKYYKPYVLNLFVNGKEVISKMTKPEMQQNVIYSYSEEDYTMPVSALEDVEGLTIEYDKYGTPLELTYKEKTYKIEGATVDLEKNTIPTYIEVQAAKEILGAKLEFDYEKQTLNIVVE